MSTKSKKYLGLIKGLNESREPLPAPKGQKGREASGGKTVQISAHIPETLFRDFNVKLAQLSRKKTDVIIELLQGWVRE